MEARVAGSLGLETLAEFHIPEAAFKLVSSAVYIVVERGGCQRGLFIESVVYPHAGAHAFEDIKGVAELQVVNQSTVYVARLHGIGNDFLH